MFVYYVPISATLAAAGGRAPENGRAASKELRHAQAPQIAPRLKRATRSPDLTEFQKRQRIHLNGGTLDKALSVATCNTCGWVVSTVHRRHSRPSADTWSNGAFRGHVKRHHRAVWDNRNIPRGANAVSAEEYEHDRSAEVPNGGGEPAAPAHVAEIRRRVPALPGIEAMLLPSHACDVVPTQTMPIGDLRALAASTHMHVV